MKILCNTKDRVLQLADTLENNKQIFFRKTGLNYGNFTGKSKKSDLGSKGLAEILTIYPNIDLYWLITGEYKKEDSTIVSEPQVSYKKNTVEDLIAEKVIQKLKPIIDENIKELSCEIDLVKTGILLLQEKD